MSALLAGTSLAEIETELARRIVAIPVAGKVYEQEPGRDAFRETSDALSPSVDPSSGHLSFAILTEDAPYLPDRQEAGGSFRVSATVSVLLLYVYRATSYGADRRAATEAARDVAGAVLADYTDANIQCVQAFRPEQLSNERLRIRITFEIPTDIPITPARST